MGCLSPVSLDRVKPNSKKPNSQKKIPAIGFTSERTKVLLVLMSCHVMEVQIVWTPAFWGWVLAPMLSCSGIFAAENPSPVIGEADKSAIASPCRRESHKFLLTSMWVVCCAACTCPASINTQSLGTLSEWLDKQMYDTDMSPLDVYLGTCTLPCLLLLYSL